MSPADGAAAARVLADGHGFTLSRMRELADVPEPTLREWLGGAPVWVDDTVSYGEVTGRELAPIADRTLARLLATGINTASFLLARQGDSQVAESGDTKTVMTLLQGFGHGDLEFDEFVAGARGEWEAPPWTSPAHVLAMAQATRLAVGSVDSHLPEQAALALSFARMALTGGWIDHLLAWEEIVLQELRAGLAFALTEDGGEQPWFTAPKAQMASSRTFRSTLDPELDERQSDALPPELTSVELLPLDMVCVLPSEEGRPEFELTRGLPDHMLLAIVLARVAHVVSALPEWHRESVTLRLAALSRLIAKGGGDLLLPVAQDLARSVQGLVGPPEVTGIAARSVLALGRTVRCAWADRYDLADLHARVAVQSADAVIRELKGPYGLPGPSPARQDVELLRVTPSRWRNPVDPHDVDAVLDRRRSFRAPFDVALLER